MASLYGAGAYTGSNPIGGGSGYASSHGYTQATADYVVTTLSALQSALSSATSGKVIWIPDGTTILCSVTDYAGVGTLKSGAVLASNRGQNGAAGGKIKNTGTSSTYMHPIVCASSNSVISGLRFEGPQGMYGTNGPGNCAIRGVSGAKRIEVENVEISNFGCGGIYLYGGGMVWNDDSTSGRHWVHHCYIHHIQKWGFGYGICQEGSCSYLVEACHFGPCRHEVMSQAASTGMEVRYSEFEDAVYSSANNNHQLDSHGGEGSSTPGCRNVLIHYNTFSKNDIYENKPNVCLRGDPTYGANIHHNWTKKTHSGQSGVFTITYPDEAFQMWGGATGTLSSHNVSCHDNWYGTGSPPGGVETAPVANFSADVTSGAAPMAVAFTDTSLHSPTVWAWNFGDGGTSTSQSPSHTYASSGSYTVTLVAQNGAGSDTETKSSYIVVGSGSSVSANFSADPTTGDRPLTVKFSNLSSNADSYSWSFGDGGASSDAAPTHTYTKVGAFDVSLTASASTAGTSGDVGGEATGARGFASGTSGYTQIFLDNPLNSAVDISQIDFDIDTAVTGAKVGTFYGSGSSYTCRDMVEIGAIGTGTVNKTLDAGNNPIALEGAVGDYIGWYCASGKIMCDHTGGSGVYYKSGDHVNTSEAISGMTLLADYVYSLYGTGSSTGASTSDTETKTSYITVAGNTAPSASFKVRVTLTPKTKLTIAGNQVSHMLANSKAGAW